MVDMEAGESARGHRVDAVMAAAIVLTVDAVVLLAVAVIGVPFLMFVFGDENGTWQRLWPLTASWLVSCVLAAACAATVARLSGFGAYSIRRVGTAAALGTAVGAAVLAAASIRTSPSLVLISLPFAVANLAAALVLASPGRAIALAERFSVFHPAGAEPYPDAEDETTEAHAVATLAAEDHAAYARPASSPAEESVTTRDTIDLEAFYGPGDRRRRAATSTRTAHRTRSRGPAAMRTLGGVQLPRRARRPRPSNRPSP